MTEMTAVVRNVDGIHMRPSQVILDTVADYPGDVRVESAQGQADLHSIMGLLTMALEQGAQVKISVTGPEESDVCRKLVELFETEFDFRHHESSH